MQKMLRIGDLDWNGFNDIIFTISTSNIKGKVMALNNPGGGLMQIEFKY